MVSTACQSGRTSIRVISPSATLMSSWWACRPSRRLSDAPSVAGGLDPAVVQQHAAVVVPDQAELALLAGADADVAGQRDGVLVAGRLPGHRHLRAAARP